MSGDAAMRESWRIAPRRVNDASTPAMPGKQRYPASSGRTVQAGIRQSIPSSSIDSWTPRKTPGADGCVVIRCCC